MSSTETLVTKDLLSEAEAKHTPLPESELQEVLGPAGPDVTKQKDGRRVMIAFDWEDDSSNVALEYYLKKLLLLDDHVFFVSALPAIMFDATTAWAYVPPSNPEDDLTSLRKWRENALKKLKEEAKKVEDRGVTTTLHVLHGEAKFVLPRAAEYHDVNLVVLGRRTRTRMQRWLGPGSVSSYVLAHASMPVLIVK